MEKFIIGWIMASLLGGMVGIIIRGKLNGHNEFKEE